MNTTAFINGTLLPTSTLVVHRSSYSYYGYTPSMSGSIVILAIFAISTFAHLGQLVHKRSWWMIAMVLGGILEAAGWASRVYSSVSPTKLDPFLAQQVTLILAPVFFSGVVYIILGLIISKWGEEYSRIRSRYYSIIFLVCDVASLVVQAVGGAKAAGGARTNDSNAANDGAHIMMGGIVFQLFSMTLFVLLAAEYSFRAYYDRPVKLKVSPPEAEKKQVKDSRGVRQVAIAMVISTLVLYVRGIYRVIELSEGWSGPIISTESYFIVLDGVMMIICMGIFNILYPTWVFTKEKEEAPTKVVEMEPID
ncbi:putative RTA1 domain protein [Planoprotostelium fungivorum]|uniref:Putative RTA1 domain protein n=1 Tax=Planoprotostelium fungivorum TaxID=1890364 RepID=A0A2P6NJE1_9EUKA|nr:putative RTA1 domain protein [Planoprotostelium fungivorum]